MQVKADFLIRFGSHFYSYFYSYFYVQADIRNPQTPVFFRTG